MINAIEVMRSRTELARGAVAEVLIWRVPEPVRGSTHYFKYRLALVVDDVCVLRYDSEAGKGDHRHVHGRELAYTFVGTGALRRDFLLDAAAWLERHGRY